MIITELLEKNARFHGDMVSLVEINPANRPSDHMTWKEFSLIETAPHEKYRRELTWKEFDVKAKKTANFLLSRGVKKGDKVAILLMNCLEWLPIYFGILKSGALAVPMNYRYTSDEIAYCSDLCDASYLIFGPDFTERVSAVKNQLLKVKTFLYVGHETPDFAENLDKLSKEAKVNNSIENIKITDETVQPADTKTANTELKTDINQTNQTKTTDAAALKTAQENLAADTSRLTANVEQMQPDAEVVTPAKTEAEKVPTIKVTQEVAATVQEQKSTGIENKDNTSKIKDKAVEQMTKLQDTDTVVTEAKTQDSAENSGSSGSGNNSAQANAGETAAKMNVEHASNINSQPADAQNFVSKLEAQLSAKSAESNRGILNQSDIMSQVNSKFEQLQQSGTNKVSIVLQPENLGKVSVEIMNSKDGIVAKMTTDNQQVKELFDKNVEALKNNLSSQGVNVNNIKVECTNESSNNAMNFERNQFEQSFNNQQNPHGNHANQSDKDAKTTYTADFGNANDFDEQTEPNQGVEIKNTQTIIKHNGKVDYTV